MRSLRITTLCLMAAVGCGGSDGPSAPAAIVVVGVFQLQTINAAGLPYSSFSGNVKTEILGDQYSLNNDQTYSEVTSYRFTQGATVTTSQVGGIGVYRSTNGAVSFTQTTPAVSNFSGTVSGNTLTVLAGSNTYVYKR